MIDSYLCHENFFSNLNWWSFFQLHSDCLGFQVDWVHSTGWFPEIYVHHFSNSPRKMLSYVSFVIRRLDENLAHLTFVRFPTHFLNLKCFSNEAKPCSVFIHVENCSTLLPKPDISDLNWKDLTWKQTASVFVFLPQCWCWNNQWILYYNKFL